MRGYSPTPQARLWRVASVTLGHAGLPDPPALPDKASHRPSRARWGRTSRTAPDESVRPSAQPTPAIPIAAATIVLLLLLLVLWNRGWLGIDPPSLPPATARNVSQVHTQRPTFSGKLAEGTEATFSLSPTVPLRWTAKADPTTLKFKTAPPVRLPPGTYTLSINGKANQTLTVKPEAAASGGALPAIAGTVKPGATGAEFAIDPAVPIRWTVKATAPDGTYQTVSPLALPPGAYTLFINDSVGQQFVVAKDAT